MATFLTTQGTTARVEAILRTAKKRIFLLSPYLRFSRTVSERLLEADRRGIPVTLVHRHRHELDGEVRHTLAQMKRLDLRSFEHLHAKCYGNEQELIISSLNLYEFSERNNREMSVQVSAGDPVYAEAFQEVEAILQLSSPNPLGARSPDPFLAPARAQTTVPDGYCIRCRATIQLRRDAPLCYTCYQSWRVYGNEYYEELFCHSCGREAETSMVRPLCGTCFDAGRMR